MTQEPLSIEQALAEGAGLPCLLARTLSRVTLGKNSPDTPWAEILPELAEARFFGGGTEIRLFRYDGALCAVRLTEQAEDDILRETYVLSPRFGKTITVHHILNTDEDGQTYRAATLLAEWKEGNAP